MADGTDADILSAPPPGPATSSTSDAPAAAPAVPAAAHAPEPAAAPSEGAEDTAAKGGEGEASPESQPAARRNQFGARLSELTAARRAAEEARAAADARADKLADLVERLTAERTPQAQPEPAAPKPMREQFADPDAYDEALVTWATTRAATEAAQKATAEFEARAKAERDAAEARQRADAERQQFETLRNGYAERRAKLLEDPEFADFELVAEAETLPITETMLPPILLAENGPNVVYHLGKNPDEAARIAALNPLQQALEIGKISARLATPERAQPSRLPRPMTPVGGNNAAARRSPDEMSMDEYAAHREPSLNNERRAGMWGMTKQA